jgi:hypothetical protein
MTDYCSLIPVLTCQPPLQVNDLIYLDLKLLGVVVAKN